MDHCRGRSLPWNIIAMEYHCRGISLPWKISVGGRCDGRPLPLCRSSAVHSPFVVVNHLLLHIASHLAMVFRLLVHRGHLLPTCTLWLCASLRNPRWSSVSLRCPPSGHWDSTESLSERHPTCNFFLRITMAPRKGMSLADKRANILSIFHESKSIFVLKVRVEFE